MVRNGSIPVQRNGFTLIELLVVIAVGAVLIILAFPISSLIEDSNKGTKNISNLRQIGIGVASFAAERNGKTPYTESTASDTKGLIMNSYGPSLTSGMAPRKLLSSRVGGDGNIDYVSPDVLYSPFAEGFRSRRRGALAGKIGFLYWYTSRDPRAGSKIGYNPDNEGLFNDRTLESPTAVIAADLGFNASVAKENEYRGKKGSVLYLDGGVKTFNIDDIAAERKKLNDIDMRRVFIQRR